MTHPPGSALAQFAKLLGLPAHHAEDALHSERAARAVLSRRSFFAAAGAMASGLVVSVPAPTARLYGFRVSLDWTEAVALVRWSGGG